jgi:FMNH2-dependent dimethyl sulfone monooxygenase
VKSQRENPDELSFGYFFPTGQTDHIWSDEAAETTPPLNKKVFCDMAQAAEAAGFDSIFIADTWSGHQRAAERAGHQSPKYHAPMLAMGLFAVTEHIGVITTMHTTHHKPAHVARMGATLDAFSDGRWGWNVVTGFGDPEARLFGHDALVEHDERYTMAGEFVDIVKQLWTEHEPIDVDGKYYRVKGRIKAPRPVQKPHPLLVSAGASPAGMTFAAQHCDMLVVAGNEVAKVRETEQKAESIAQSIGRTNPLAVSPFAIAIVRENEGEAEEEYERLCRSLNYEATVELTADILGDIKSIEALFEGMTREQAAHAWGSGRGILKFMGTADQVAEQLIAMKRETATTNILINFPLWSPREVLDFRPVLDRLREAGIWSPPEVRDYSW